MSGLVKRDSKHNPWDAVLKARTSWPFNVVGLEKLKSEDPVEVIKVYEWAARKSLASTLNAKDYPILRKKAQDDLLYWGYEPTILEDIAIGYDEVPVVYYLHAADQYALWRRDADQDASNYILTTGCSPSQFAYEWYAHLTKHYTQLQLFSPNHPAFINYLRALHRGYYGY